MTEPRVITESGYEIGHVLDVLGTLADNQFHCCVTSPPYWGLRDYDVDGQVGNEPTLGEYVSNMVAVFREVRRVLRPDGTLWLNIGDSYNRYPHVESHTFDPMIAARNRENGYPARKITSGLPEKSLFGLPWRVALAMQDDGWILRQDIIWHKSNPMPESVKDRCTKSHEYVFLMAKSKRYYYDMESMKEPVTGGAHPSGDGVNPNASKTGVGWGYAEGKRAKPRCSQDAGAGITRNKRSVWTIPTKSFNSLTRTDHLARVEPGVFSGGMKHIVSGDCPVHGGLLALLAILKCGRHEVYLNSRSERISQSLASMREADCVQVDQLCAYYFGGKSLGSLIPGCSDFASSRNNRIRRMAHEILTRWPCRPSARTVGHIVDMLKVLEYAGPLPSIDASNTLLDEMDAHLLGRTLHSTVDKSSLFKLHDKCTCGFYHKTTKKVTHFATFPEALVHPCVKAGCPAGGIVLDPFFGSGTTGRVCEDLGRRWFGIELNGNYEKLILERTAQMGLFMNGVGE